MPTIQFKGKTFVQNHHLAVPYHQLVPDKEKSLTEIVGLNDNLIVHGDNLVALKALLPTYAGKVKCIYIDPPYNTGNEGWVYNDNVKSPIIKDWIGKVVGKEGEDLTRHDKWLSMMMPRLKLLRELLKEDGAIFISCDDNEQHHLRPVLDEIFGEENYLYTFMWQKVDSPNDNKVSVAINHEYIVLYAKSREKCELNQLLDESILEAYSKRDEQGRLYRDRLLKKNGKNSLRSDRPSMFFPVTAPDGTEVLPVHDDGRDACWAYGLDSIEQLKKEGRLIWVQRSGKWVPYVREYAREDSPLRPYPTIWNDLPTMRQAKAELKDIFSTQAESFPTPKPTKLILRILRMITNQNDLVLDSFAGSGTTAQAVLELNKEDGGERKFILVEMEDYANTITAERVRRVINGVPDAKSETLKAGLGGTFSFFTVGDAIETSSLLSGEKLPTYTELARYVYYTATGEEFNDGQINEERNYVGKSKQYDVYVYYKPDIEYLKSTALSLDEARRLRDEAGDRPLLVFAPTKYVEQTELDNLKITFCQLPFEIYKVNKHAAA